MNLERLESFHDAALEWTALAETIGNVFATPEFLSSWWRWFGRGRPLRLYAARDEDRTVGFVPLYESRTHPAGVLRFLGHGAGDQLGPLIAPAFRPAVAASLRSMLADGPARVLIGEQLPRDEGWGDALEGRRIATEGSPVLRFRHSSWDEHLAAQSANLRQQIRRRERRIAKEHELRYTFAATRDDLDAGLDALFALHRARWSSAETNFSRREPFHREFAALALERGWARMWLLEIDGVPAAAWYGLRFANAECYYQMGRDPRWDHASVGFVLLVHSIREALADGMREYRFLRGGESYKYRLATGDPGLETVAAAHGVVATAAVAVARAVVAGRRAVRGRRPHAADESSEPGTRG